MTMDSNHVSWNPDDFWNRAAEGASSGMREGDLHLSRALTFHGYAEGDGCLEAIEQSVETETGLDDCMSAFSFFGCDDVSEAIKRMHQLWIGALKDETGSSLSKLEKKADRKYASLNIESRLTESLELMLNQNPEYFAPMNSRQCP